MANRYSRVKLVHWAHAFAHIPVSMAAFHSKVLNENFLSTERLGRALVAPSIMQADFTEGFDGRVYGKSWELKFGTDCSKLIALDSNTLDPKFGFQML